jgi:uncharacterized membrane protein HdeD (DUF308 family)
MTIGASLLLIAAGAILHWAVTDSVSGIDLATVGTILLIVGVVGLILGLILTMRPAYIDRRAGVVERRPPDVY